MTGSKTSLIVEAHGAEVSTKDANHKFLRSLPPTWSNLAMTMRTKPDVDTLSIDDFSCTPTSLNNIKDKESSCWFCDELIYSLFAKQSEDLDLLHEDLEQIDDVDIKEMDINWQIAMIAIRMKIYTKELEGESGIDGKRNSVKKLEAQVVTFQKQQLSLNEQLTFQANEIYAKDEKLKKYRRIGMKAVKEKEQLQKIVDSWKNSSKNLWKLVDSGMTSNSKVGLGYEIQSNNEVLSYEEEMNRTVFKCTEEDFLNKPLYSRFSKTDNFKGVPHPLTGDYTPKPQEEIDDSLYVYGKKGPQKPEISDSDDNSTEHSTCQSNDSEGSFGNPSEHSSESESESISVPNEMSTSKSVTTNEKVVSESKEVEPSCATHVKTPRQQMKNQGTPEVKGKNWNKIMERELGEGYSFIKKKCFVCGSLSHLIKDCDFYEKKMAREAELKKQRVFNTGNGVAKPVWNNANRVNRANHFVPRPVQLNAVRSNVNTGRTNVNSVRHNVNSVRTNVNTGRSKQPVPTNHTNSFGPVRPQVNKFNQRSHFSKSHSPVRRPIVRNTARMTYSHAVKGNWGTAVRIRQKSHENDKKKRASTDTRTEECTKARSQSTLQTPNAMLLRKKMKDGGAYYYAPTADMPVGKRSLLLIQRQRLLEENLDELAQKHLREVPKNKATNTNSVNSGSGQENTQPADREEFRCSVSPIPTLGFTSFTHKVNSGEPKNFSESSTRMTVWFEVCQRSCYSLGCLGTAAASYVYEVCAKLYMEYIKRPELGMLLLINISRDSMDTEGGILTSICLLRRTRKDIHGFQMSSMGELIFFLGLQVKQKTDGIFISQDKYVADMLKKFDLASVKTAITPMETKMALTKDEEADEVDVHLYRSMIGYSRLHTLYAVKSILTMQRNKHSGTSTTEAEYVAAQVLWTSLLWVQNQMLDYGFNFMNTKIHIDNESTICIVKNPVYHSKTKHIEIRHHFIRDSYEKKLIRVEKIHTDFNVADLLTKAFDGPRFNFLVVNIGMINPLD
ncbi:putative ribonuclease H-like domain-containing protein [Tanacetum coccineum]